MHVSHVVVGFDFSHSAHVALDRAVALAARAPQHVLHVVCVIDPRTPIPSIPAYDGVDPMYAARIQEALAVSVHEALDAVEPVGRVHFFVHARIARNAADELCEVACEVGADLIVVGSHGLTGVERMLIGSVAERVVRNAGCAVEVARATHYPIDEHTPPPDHLFIPPHRYTYEDHRANLRPPEWPLS
jgi:nucleotide-binding universal stress UspA family protein